MELIYDYIKNDALRHELNALTQKTFGFDFENWVTAGYFQGDYIPYSFEENGKLLANVSANKMCFMQKGVRKNYIQIGTVMTDEFYRKQGLAKRLMEYVIKEYKDRCDGIYLFANLGALDFYRKLGFKEGLQYQYVLKNGWKPDAKSSFIKVDPQDEKIKLCYLDAVKDSVVVSAFEHTNKFGLQMFYTANLENVYYAADLDLFAVMEKENGTLMLQSIIGKKQVSLQDVIDRIDAEYDRLQLGFTPRDGDVDMFEASSYDGGEDYRLFYLGEDLESIEKEKLFFPVLSHA